MIPKGPELNKLSYLISQQVEQVTCLECCKTYIAPETAPCGHTLCHICWKKRRTCPLCSSAVNRQSTKLNLALQNLTEHINTLGETFEKVFNIKLDEFMLDTPGEFVSEEDPSKNVKEWLASSQNQFSAPITTSEPISQEPVAELQVQSKALVHTSTVILNKPTKVVCRTIAQDDWDKIEPMAETVDKDKENVEEPIDIEPFDVNDNSYTMQNPRRSLRKKDGKIIDFIDIKTKSSSDKLNSKESSIENDNKTSSVKQNWNNVKRMRKEFSKLNKKNKNKLNVSIEMYKKTQLSNNKSNIDIPVLVSEQVFEIDDNTPNIENKKNDDLCIADNLPQKDCTLSSSKGNNIESNPNQISNNSNKNHLQVNVNEPLSIKTKSIKPPQQPAMSHNASTLVKDIEMQENNNFNEPVNTKIAFIKKAPLYPTYRKQTCNKETSYHNIDMNPGNTNSNSDIQICIKIGDRMTNITINKDKNDLPVKACTDQEIQVSLGSYNIHASNINSIEVGSQTKQSKSGHLTVQGAVTNTGNKILSENKSSTTKKNTASAETATAQFEITESVERELSKMMECESINNEQNFCNINKQASSQVDQTDNVKCSKNRNVFDSLQANNFQIKVKDNNVQLLKNTNKVPSEILLPSIHSNKYKNADKRSRETNSDYDLPINKKMKINSKDAEEMPIDSTSHCGESEKCNHESELITYETVINQVFGNIDKDIEIGHQSVTSATSKTGKETKSLTQKSKIVSIPLSNHSELSTNNKDYYDQKESENMFTIIEKDNENCDRTMKSNVPVSTQQQLQDLLTPVMCRNLELQEYTPHIDDKDDESDKSIVEDTPQKNVSFSKLRQKNESSVRMLEQSQKVIQPEVEKKNTINEKNKSVINLSESVEFNKGNKDGTTIECAIKKHTLETPLNINKFVDHIKHKSTPVARKSLNFANENKDDEDPEITLCPTSEVAKNTQEKEFMSKAFESTPDSPKVRSLALKNLNIANNKRLCIAGSCLTSSEITKLKNLCLSKKWVYVDKYTKDVTHLVVGVDEDNRSQRSVKYMSALAAGKWIVSFEWVEKSLKATRWVDEANFEVLDSTGEPGPKRSRVAKRKLFQGITFYCMPPFSVLDVNTLKAMLEAAGGRVVNEIKQVRVTENSPGPALLLAEPENTQEDRFIYLTVELGIVPVNYEWVLNSLGNYTLGSLQDLLLCAATLLPKATSQWPSCFFAREDDD